MIRKLPMEPRAILFESLDGVQLLVSLSGYPLDHQWFLKKIAIGANGDDCKFNKKIQSAEKNESLLYKRIAICHQSLDPAPTSLYSSKRSNDVIK